MCNKKHKENMLAITFTGLFIANKLFVFAAMISFYLMIAAAGDGKVSDGDLKIAIISLASGIICAIIAKSISIAMHNVAKTCRKKQVKHDI